VDRPPPPKPPRRIDADTPAEALAPRQFLMPLAIGIPSLVVMLAVAGIEDLPIRDPDARFVGSPLALISLVCLLFLLLDVVPRAVRQARSSEMRFGNALREVFDARWWGRRGLIVVACILGFYAAYLSYRNLKSFLPFVTDGALYDGGLLDLDEAMFFGNQPSTLLHDLLGTGLSAEALSAVYLTFLTFVPVSLGVALVWSSRIAAGLWYVTSLAIVWMLGVLSYYVVPSLGPIYARPELFADLPETGVSELSVTLLEHRNEVIADPFATDAVQGIAGFASLHVAVIFTAALIAHLTGAPRPLRIALWVFLGLTILATVYFGWHYVIDDVAGVAIAAVGVYAAARLLGFRRPFAVKLGSGAR
jgi:membrane-associated phospholipid phosphatase